MHSLVDGLCLKCHTGLMHHILLVHSYHKKMSHHRLPEFLDLDLDPVF
jgi:hypothetical protein